MSYLDQSLTFEPHKICYEEGHITFEVMMDWEDDLMSASAAYVCQNGGDILEIGFGMGISAGYIQSHSITSHTIVENHPDVIVKAKAWAKNRANVTIVTGSWYDVKNQLSTYDGLFYDTWGDDDAIHFSSSLSNLMNVNGLVTWWNDKYSESNSLGIEQVTYESIAVTPPENGYFNNTTYYMPKKQF